MDDSRVKDVGTLLRAFFDEDKIRQGSQYADFFSSWKYIVGPREASHSRVVDIERGILIIEAEHPGWIQLLQLRQASILSAAQSRFPELQLRGVAFRLQKDKPGPASGRGERILPGPFGPEAASPSGESSDASQSGSCSRPEPEEKHLHYSIDSFDDAELRERLAELKKAIDEGKK